MSGVYLNSQSPSYGTVFDRRRLQAIAKAFDIPEIKTKDLSDVNLHNKCFKKILRACETDRWEKINAVRELIYGMKNTNGRTIYECLTSREEAPPNFCTDPPENLIFQGGGPKGIAYIGTLDVLEKRKLMPFIKRVGGTSAGAITSALIAVTYSAAEIKLLIKKPLRQLFDFPSCNGGIAKGEDFLKLINELIWIKTGINNCTFGELHAAIKRGEPFKHLHVFAIKIGANKEIFHFSSDDKRWTHLVIASAVRASISLPVVFQPYTLRFKDPESGLCEDRDVGLFMDGGILVNFPIEAFDKKKYVTKNLSKMEKECPIINKRTLAFALYTPGEEIPKKETRVDCIVSAYFEYLDVRDRAEIIFKKNRAYDIHRTVMISNVHVGTYLGIFETQEKLDELIESGEACTEMFFQDRERRINRLRDFEKIKVPIAYKAYNEEPIYLVYKNSPSKQLIVGIQIMGETISFHTNYLCSFAALLNPMRNQFSFIRLAEFDERFLLFSHLCNKEFSLAEEVFKQHCNFFKNCFLWDIFKKLVIERNQKEYILFFAEKGFSFKSQRFNYLWYAYHHKALKALSAFLHLPDTDLQTVDPKSGRTLLHQLVADHQNDLTVELCAVFKQRYPDIFFSYLAKKQLFEKPNYSPDALDVAINENNAQAAEFLIEEGFEFEDKLDHWVFQIHMRQFDREVATGNLHRSSRKKIKSASYHFLMKVFSWDFRRTLSAQTKMQLLNYCCGRFLTDGGEDAIWPLIVRQILPFPKDTLRDQKGNGPLLVVLNSAVFTCEYKCALVNLLLYGAYPDDINQSNDAGETPLIVAAKSELSLLQIFLQQRAVQVNYQDKDGNTALHHALFANGARRIKALLSRNDINIDIANHLGQTPRELYYLQENCVIS